MKNQIELIKYLLGLSDDILDDTIYDKARQMNTPPLTPLPRMYLNEVNRFLFSGGVHADIENALSIDPRQDFIDTLAKVWKLQARLYKVWEAGATYGQIGFILKPKDNLYKLEFARKTELLKVSKDCVIVQKVKLIKQREYYYRIKLTPDAYIQYPLVPANLISSYDWGAAAEPVPHGYGEIPFVLVNNTEELFESTGQPEFDIASCKMACYHAMTSLDLIENAHFFGSPLLASPNPKETIAKLKKKIQVLSKEPHEDGGAPEYINIDPIKKEHLELLGKLEANFRKHMGLSEAFRDLPTQISNVALKTLNSATIDVAQSKWLNYVDCGLVPLFELSLRMAHTDGLIRLQPTKVTVTRNKPYFAESPQEKLQNATYAQTLIDMGMDRATVIQEVIYPYLTVEQVNQKLNPMLTEE